MPGAGGAAAEKEPGDLPSYNPPCGISPAFQAVPEGSAMWPLLLSFFLPAIAGFATAFAQGGRPVAAMPVVQKWQTFTDPDEGAFQLKMPAGWKNSGGTKRYSALQYRPWATAVSPDGATILAIGDPSEPAYTLPMIGFRPGSIYNASGTYYIVQPLQSAQQYAVGRGMRKLASLCTGVKSTGSHARDDIAQQLNGLAGAMGISHTYGDASFSCERNGMALSAYVFLGITVMRTSAYSALWWPDSMIAFLAPAPMAGVAAGVLSQMLRTVTFNPQWLARQSQTAVNVSQTATRTNNVISDSIMRGWEQHGATIDRIMEAGSRARLGIDVYADPATGTQYTVSNNYNYYWIDAAGHLSGTSTDTPPGTGFKRLDHVPPR
jgi:hypothetical protein